MFIKALSVFGLLVAGFLVYVALQPADFMVARELEIKATPEQLFPFINNSQKANDWMPWIEQDPQLKMTYSGPVEGVGSRASWTSDGRMGHGESEVVESIPNQLVRTKLTYTQPMSMSQMAAMTLTPTSGGTILRWSVEGKNNFIGRIFCTFMNMDKMVGGEFEKGLAKLKAMVEAPQG